MIKARDLGKGPLLRRAASLLAAGLLVGGLLAISPTSGASTKTAQNSVTLTLYNGQHVQTTSSLVAAFEKATGINVAVRSNDEDAFADEIVAEGSRSLADVIYSENSPVLEYLQQRGLLSSVVKSTLSRTPARFNSPQEKWVGVSARVSVIIYNPSLIKKSDLPTSVLGLASSRFKGKIAFSAGETDFQPIVTSVARAYGQKKALSWLEGMKANAGSHLYPDNETVTSQVNRGAVAFGVIDQYYWYRMRSEIGASRVHSLIAYFAPKDPGYVIDVSGAAILKSSHHQAAAQKFLAFLVSKQGQEIIAHSTSYEYPIASGVKTAQPEAPFLSLRPDPIDIADLGTGATAIALLRKAQLL